MAKEKYRRLALPQIINVGGVDTLFSDWHCFELINIKTNMPFTRAVVKDSLGRTIEVRFCDLLVWPDVVMLEKDFGMIYVGETVDILDPSTSDGDTIVVSVHGKEMRVPVAIITPVKQHAWKAAHAV